MSVVLAIVVVLFVVFVAGIAVYYSGPLVERRARAWARRFETDLRQETIASLRDRIASSDYWNLSEEPLEGLCVSKR